MSNPIGEWEVHDVVPLLTRPSRPAERIRGTVGLIGSDQMQRYGWVIFDYSGGRLVLGANPQT